MTPDEIRQIVLSQLSNIAPEADPAAVDPTADLREALDLDSMDFLNFVIALHERLKIDIPETDYPRLVTIAGAVDYLLTRIAGRAGPTDAAIESPEDSRC